MLGRSEPFDAIRAVNALLTGIDRLRNHPNVIFLCTSNLVTALVRLVHHFPKWPARQLITFSQDPAFIDRVDIKQFMPHLSNKVIYAIYKDCLEELSRVDVVEGAVFEVIPLNPDDPQTRLHYVEEPARNLALPEFEEMLLNYQMFPDAIPTELAGLASLSTVRCHTPTIVPSRAHLISKPGLQWPHAPTSTGFVANAS